MPYRRVPFAQKQYYHLYNRGVRRQPIFREEDNYLFALRLVKRYTREFSLRVIAYCLLPNHYHFLVRQDGEKPAGLLPHRVFNSYTKAFNRRYNRAGTLFEGRYKAIHIDRDEYLLHLCRYIHTNPVKHKIVSHLLEWPYSNFHEWLGVRDGTLIDRNFVREHFPEAQDYGQFVSSYLAGISKPPEGIDMYLLE